MFLLGMALWLTAACGSATPATGAPSAAAPGPDLVPAVLQVPVRMMQPPFDRPRQTLVPAGWTMSLWARVPGARLASWAPDGTLLVSRPSAGQVVRLSPAPDGLESTVLLGGLAQPYGLAFAGDTLYVAESDEIVGYQYHAGVAAGRHVVVDGLPDQRSPELGGAYAHALKSVAVGPDASCCRRTWPTTPSRNWRG